jgi:hypothetical protein
MGYSAGMNNAQVIGMRELWTSATSNATAESYTAREFALNVSHRLYKRDFAKTSDGRTFKWNATTEMWEQIG